MGGRGSSSGVSLAGKPYGSEYKTLLRVGNVKFLMHNHGPAAIPLETMSASKNRVYATVNSRGNIKYVTTYSEDGLAKIQYDLVYSNNKLISIHYHNWTGESRGVEHRQLSAKEYRWIEGIVNEWQRRNI